MSYSDGNSYEEILARCLSSERLENVDKRVGSIIYDALAPLCLELAEAYIKMDIMDDQSYLLTATGSNLDRRVYDYGVSREKATKALMVASFKKYENGVLVDMDIDYGTRFSAQSNPNLTYIYRQIPKTVNGNVTYVNLLECENAGSGGSNYIGAIIPLTPLRDLAEANIVSVDTYGQDEETDDELRARTLDYINNTSFGGNIADYVNKVISMDGVGNVKVFPAWNYDETNSHNGSVLVVPVSSTYDPLSQAAINNIKEELDPDEYTGLGYGIAPIGHYVTVMTPTEADVNFYITVEKNEERSEGEVTTIIENAINDFIDSKRRDYSQGETIHIFSSEVIARLMDEDVSPEYISNVVEIRLNGVANRDIYYNDVVSSVIQTIQIPKVGTISVNFQ